MYRSVSLLLSYIDTC